MRDLLFPPHESLLIYICSPCVKVLSLNVDHTLALLLNAHMTGDGSHMEVSSYAHFYDIQRENKMSPENPGRIRTVGVNN
jgi:hypothetical protein